MANRNDRYHIPDAQLTDLAALERVDDHRFTGAMDDVVRESEAMRLRYMKQHRGRGFLTMTLGMILALCGATAFGWYFLVQFDLARAVMCMIPAVLVPFILHGWSEAPLKHYIRDYKRVFMPKMAAALGGFKFNSDRGVPREVIGKTGVVPPHDSYSAEDCFLGNYKGVKVMFSEARLYKRGHTGPVFQGIFVLLETPHKVFEGHTIITADRAMAQQSAATRWSKLTPVKIKVENPDWDRFLVYSDKPEDAALFVGEKLLKELSEAADVFNKALITAVMFRGKYIFMMVPNKGDMFEPSSVFVPVSTKQHALNCKKEIERILEIIDVFEIYKSGNLEI
jgi:hypothetical protein